MNHATSHGTKSTTTRNSLGFNAVLPFITGLDMYHVAGLDMYQQPTMNFTEDAAVFNAVDGKAAVNEYKAMQWTSGVKWSCRRNSEL